MLTKEQNARFTQVGPSTPMGNLFRRYWMPFATVTQLMEHPTRAVSLLGEHLVAYRDRSGNFGLIQEFCPHRNVNLLWGIPEVEGLRCPYHGWLFDNSGNCLEQPAEAPDSTFKDRIQIHSYPVEELGGMLWAWMGPEPRPMVPRWEAFVKEGVRDIGWAVLPCNWLQIMENSLDPVHVEWLHRYFSNYVLERLGLEHDDPSFWREHALVKPHEKIGFDVFEHGIVKRRVLKGDNESHPNWRLGHVICFPNMLRQDQIRVPMDDTHTLYWWYNVHKQRSGDPEQRPENIPIYKVPLPGVDREGLPIWDIVDNNSGQDNYAWASQGPVTPRWTEHLGESDKGIILYRRLLSRMMRVAEDGGDPMNTFRDPSTNVSVHVPHENDDVAWRAANPFNREGAISTGRSGKYSPVAQERAQAAGFATPKPIEKELAGFGQIHPRD
ncbi:MAG TPA: Rieske 2Fe-2S domain-containing protein [Dehalococcoidia bacterium]|nr:Rieske 2Fe-2S domain-containing protein [Dehalococcoidia bacterium]